MLYFYGEMPDTHGSMIAGDVRGDGHVKQPPKELKPRLSLYPSFIAPTD
jgi:hypothetical protein